MSHFIRACFLISQRRTNGYLSCMECGVVVDRSRDLTLQAIDGKTTIPANSILVCATCRKSES